jgi:hypothetical protein
MPDLNIGIPEILVVVVIGLFLWVGRRFPPSKSFGTYILVALAILVAVLLFNYATRFRAVD